MPASVNVRPAYLLILSYLVACRIVHDHSRPLHVAQSLSLRPFELGMASMR